MPNGLVIPGGVSFPLLAPDGTALAPSYSFANYPTSGMYTQIGQVRFAVGGVNYFTVAATGVGVLADGVPFYLGLAADVRLNRLAAASLVLGSSPSATPVAQTFTVGEASRPGTDSNVGGASGTFRSGLGTGTGTASSLIFQTPDLVASGSGAQAYATRFTIATAGITATVPFQVPNGSTTAPGLAIGSSTIGIWKSGNVWTFTNGDSSGTDGLVLNPSGTTLQIVAAANILTQITNYTVTVSGAGIGSYGFTTGINAGGAATTALFALADASLRLGLSPSATPIAQTFTIGEASRPGTDSNVGGASGTIRSGLGTGTGTPSSLIFQTPDLVASGSTTQTYATRLTVATAGVSLGSATVTTPLTLWGAGGACTLQGNGANSLTIFSSVYLTTQNATDTKIRFYYNNVESAVIGSNTSPGSLLLGAAPSATPINQTFTIGESSRGGTDLNVAGANGTIRSGLGTGNAAGTSLIFQVSVPLGSSTVAQTYTQVLSLSALGATFDIPDQGLRINGQVSGAGAGAGTLTNAPAAGNPNFWLPINCGGTVFFFPGW